MAAALGRLTNDLQAPAVALQPVIGEVLNVLENLPGALLARMSGSGATCFAIFATPEAAARGSGKNSPAGVVELGRGSLRATPRRPMSGARWDVAKR